MRFKMFALILTLTAVSLAQTTTQAPPSSPQPSTAQAEKAKGACCDKMSGSDSKDGHASCMRHGDQMGDGKDMASCCAGKADSSCCSGKDAKSCMKGDKTAASCCKDGCGKDTTAKSCCDRKSGQGCGKSCCGSNKSEKPA